MNCLAFYDMTLLCRPCQGRLCTVAFGQGDCVQLHLGKGDCVQLHLGKADCVQLHLGKADCVQLHLGEADCVQLHLAREIVYSCIWPASQTQRQSFGGALE